jgi:ligand-binding sensor domain-containing protein
VVPDLPWDPASLAPETPAGKAWLGTDRGVARIDPVTGTVDAPPLAPLHAGPAWRALEPTGRRLALMGDDGIVFVGPRRPLDGIRTNRVAPGIRGRIRTMAVTWELRDAGVLQRRLLGRDRLHLLPGQPAGIALAGGIPFVGTDQGLFRYEADRGRFAPVAGLGGVTRLVSDPEGTLWVITDGRVASVGPDLAVRSYLRTRPPIDLDPDRGVVWVGTEDGMDVLSRDSGDVVELLRTRLAPIRVEAVDADDEGGCWVGTDAGQVIHLDVGPAGGATIVDLVEAEPPAIRDILARGREGAWVLTDQGLFAVALPAHR